MKIKERKIKEVTEVKYLGLKIDHQLSWDTHIKQALQKGSALMRALAAKKWPLLPQAKPNEIQG